MQGENSVSTLTQQQVDVIASRVLDLLKTPGSQSVEACSTTQETAQCQTQPGAFPTVDAAVNAARI